MNRVAYVKVKMSLEYLENLYLTKFPPRLFNFTQSFLFQDIESDSQPRRRNVPSTIEELSPDER